MTLLGSNLLQAEMHVVRWSMPDPAVLAARGGNEGQVGGAGALSFASAQESLKPVNLEVKQMEALYTLRFLKTKRDRLRVRTTCVHPFV